MKPTKYLTIFKPRCIVITALLAWAIPFTRAFLLVFVLDQETKPNAGFAMCIISFPYLYKFSVLIAFVYSPNLVIGFCYWKIYKQVKMHNANASWRSSNVPTSKSAKPCLQLSSHFSVFLFLLISYLSSQILKNIHIPRDTFFFWQVSLFL